MKINPQIFKAYDIRGIYPQEINEQIAYLVGRAFVKFLKKPKVKIMIGRDNRISSPALFKALTEGIRDQGGNVIDIGLSTTPMLYFGVAYFKLDGGINITASHNPPEYNGFKIVREKAIPVGEKSGLKTIKKLAEGKFSEKKKRGKIISKKILPDYIKFNLRGVNFSKLKSLKIVVDTANAVGGVVVSEIFKKIPLNFYHLFKKLDGNFPNHLPDPLVKENLKALQAEVLNKKADLGVALDGDGDRIFFVDERGERIFADLICALISSLILEKNPGQKILYDVRSSNIVREVIKEKGGIPIVGRVGHSFIKERMRKENIIFAGEFSGHYFHRQHFFCECPFFVLFSILNQISQSQKPLSQLIKPLKKYFHSGEINFKVKAKEKILKRLAQKYRKGKISVLDGLRVDFKDWWFNVRASHTEPKLRLVVEANSPELLAKKKKELMALIEK